MTAPPLQYIARTREYYQILGFGKPYDWAHFDTVPFTVPEKPLNESRVAIVTTAAPYQPDKGDQGPTAAYNASAKFYTVYSDTTSVMPDLRISHIAIDRAHTVANDIGAYFPLAALKESYMAGRIGDIAPRFFGLPTNRSKRTTADVDCQELLSQCKSDNIDMALLVPNCPVCHQSVSFAARTLEEAGIVTVVMGCAKDIVEHVGVPRFLFSDLPLGNAAGLPGNPQSQSTTLSMALQLAETATTPRTTHQSPIQWHGDANWKDDYSNAAKLSEHQIAEKRTAFVEAERIAKLKRQKNTHTR